MSEEEAPFICNVEGCTWGPNGGPYEAPTPQGRGMHKYHKHGIPGDYTKRKKPKKSKELAPLDGIDLVSVVLEQVFPQGIPVDKRHAVQRWEDATMAFIKEVS